MRSLFAIGEDLERLEQLLTDVDGEITDDQVGAAIEAWFDSLAYERDEKVRRICSLIEMMGLNAEACAEEVRRLGRLQRANANGADRLKNRLKKFFEEHAIDKLNLGIFRPRIQPNGGVRKLIFPEAWEQEPASSPEAFHKMIVTLDTAAIRETVEGFYARAEQITAGANDDHERRRLFKEWIENDDEARATKELIEGCSIAPRGNHLRLR